MTPEKPDQPAPWKGLLGAIALSWLPVVLFRSLAGNKATEPKAFGFAAAGAMLVVVVYVISRKHAWSAILWVPLMLIAAIGGLTLLGIGISTPTSGPSAAPLEGVAVLMMLLLAAGFGLIAMTGGLLRPKTWNASLLVIAGLNTALMAVATSSGYRGVTAQEILINLSDPSGSPVPGAAVKYERFGYGASGSTVFDASGGPLYSDGEGVVRVPSRRMRYETRMRISKEGFREITVMLGMQFSEHDKTRTFSISTVHTRAIASGVVPATDPVRLSLHLSPEADLPSPQVRHFGLYSKHDVQPDLPPKSLDLETGKFTADLTGDLGLEYYSATMNRFRDQRLRVRGLNGVQVCLVSRDLEISSPQSPYPHLYRIAPESGYQTEVIIENPGNSPGPCVYVRTADGKLHGRLCLEALGDGVNETPRYSGTLEINPSGRNLEWVKKSD